MPYCFFLNVFFFKGFIYAYWNFFFLIAGSGRYGSQEGYSGEGYSAYEGGQFQTVPGSANTGPSGADWTTEMAQLPHPAFLTHHTSAGQDTKGLLQPPMHPGYSGKKLYLDSFKSSLEHGHVLFSQAL